MLNGTKDKFPIIEYNVISGRNLDNLIRNVNEAITKGTGWQPLGPITIGVFVEGNYNAKDSYYQTMVKYSESYTTN